MPIKRYPFPRPRLTGKLPSADKLAKMSARQRRSREELSWSFRTRVIRWMGRCALRAIGVWVTTRGTQPTPERLTAWLEAVAERDGARWIVHPYDVDGRIPRNMISTEAIPEMAAEAARWALDVYDPGVHARAVNGGQASRRPRTYTLADLAGREHLSRAAAARQIGCSESTVARLRREARSGQ